MFKLLVVLSVCVVLAAGDPAPEPAKMNIIRIFTDGNSQAIMTSMDNYGITHESFHDHHLLSASVNGDTVTWINSICEESTSSRDNQTIYDAIKHLGETSANNVYLGRDNSDNQYMIDTSGVMTTFGSAVDFAPKLAKVFINFRFITFVRKDGQVWMTPVECLNDDELTVYYRMRQEEQVFRSNL